MKSLVLCTNVQKNQFFTFVLFFPVFSEMQLFAHFLLTCKSSEKCPCNYPPVVTTATLNEKTAEEEEDEVPGGREAEHSAEDSPKQPASQQKPDGDKIRFYLSTLFTNSFLGKHPFFLPRKPLPAPTSSSTDMRTGSEKRIAVCQVEKGVASA